MKFKNEKDEKLFFKLHPLLCSLAFEFDWFCRISFKKEIIITQTLTTLEEDTILSRVSNAHRTGRAIDVRTENYFSKEEIDRILFFLNETKKFEHLKYLSQTGVKRLAHYHSGSAPHLHVAIHQRFLSDFQSAL